MATIPQRELRNDISSILRRAEQGERFTITVNGRPVADLGPHDTTEKPRRTLDEILRATPVDPGWQREFLAIRENEYGFEDWAPKQSS
jgi:prevent-host-death family protein